MQRVPASEKQGRRHSSQVTVVILEEGTATAPVLDRGDVRVDIYRDSGPGGQHRNKVSSAVRLTHLPTGVVVTATEDRSQHRNRAVAWERLEEALANQAADTAHQGTNSARADTFGNARAWTWTAWRDEVRGPGKVRASMQAALAGRLGLLLG